MKTTSKKKNFSYLTYLLKDLTPAGFVTIRRWLQHESESIDKNENKQLNKRKKLLINNSLSLISRNARGSGSTLDTYNAPSSETTSGCASLAKQSQLLLHRMEQFIWSLRQILGEVDKLPSNVKSVLKKTILLTKKNEKIMVNLAINYGSKNEILNAIKKNKKKINIKNFEKNLYTKNIPDPDILIRTGGHQRLSNFMLWQLAYTELFFLKKLWPEFNTNDLISIIKRYKKSKRNFGNI